MGKVLTQQNGCLLKGALCLLWPCDHVTGAVHSATAALSLPHTITQCLCVSPRPTFFYPSLTEILATWELESYATDSPVHLHFTSPDEAVAPPSHAVVITVPLSFRICECVVPYFDSSSPDARNVSLVPGCVFVDLLTHHRLMVDFSVFCLFVFCFDASRKTTA